MAILIDFEKIAAESWDRREIGGKAAGLVRLRSWGFPVPRGAVLGASTFRRFIGELGIGDCIGRILRGTTGIGRGVGADPAACAEAGSACRAIVLRQDTPGWLLDAISEYMDSTGADGQGWAVRSSAVQEDMERHSFAGQYSSFLNLRSAETAARAVVECWASLYNPGAIAYGAERGFDLESRAIGVVFQRMLSPQKSGVLFSVDPVTGHESRMLIESSWGLGESIVKGTVEPDRFLFDWRTGQLVHSTIGRKERALRGAASGGIEELEVERGESDIPSLSPQELSRLCSMALEAQRRCGYPVDLEWAIEGGSVYLLQCRPETSIGSAWIEGEWTTADFKDGGVSSTVCAPFMWALYDLIWERAMPDYILSVRMIDSVEGIRWGRMFYGRPYWNVGIVKDCLERLPGFVERNFDEDLGIEPSYEGTGRVSRKGLTSLLRGIRTLAALSRAFRLELAGAEAFKRASLTRLTELDAIDHRSMGKEEFYDFFGRFIREDYRRSESGYFHLIFNNSNFQSLYRGQLRAAGADVVRLLSGLRGLTHLGPNIALWDISRRIRSSAADMPWWRERGPAEISAALSGKGDGPAFADLRAYLLEYRHHSTRELDIMVPRIDEDPRMIVETLKQLVELDDSHDPRAHEERQAAAYREELERLMASVPKRKRRSLHARIDRMREFLWWREEFRDLSTRFYYFVRKYTLRLGELLRDDGFLEKAQDIFFLDLEAIFSVLDGLAARDSIRAAVGSNRACYESFRNFRSPDELGRGREIVRCASSAEFGATSGVPHERASDLRVMRGLACSAGRATGAARLVENISAAGSIREGDILLTRYTDPGWTPYFSLLAGVVTETGGLLSHAAVISREYGMPAVLAVKGLVDGARGAEKAWIDGDEGTVALEGNGPP
jgi:phosphohistidine swiveling domain-containing protein